jgi:hypothetical protein
LEHFFRDLQKYKPWFSATAWEAWESFMATFDDFLSSPSADVQWRLPELVSAAIIAAQAHVQDSPSLYTGTAHVLEKESAVPPKVCVLCNAIV